MNIQLVEMDGTYSQLIKFNSYGILEVYDFLIPLL
jgi:hypothetical protein